MTDRLLRAIECPYVDVLGHPTGRLILRREATARRRTRSFAAAAAAGVAMEINGQVDRLDLDERTPGWRASAACSSVIDSDAHQPAALANVALGRHRGAARLARRRTTC